MVLKTFCDACVVSLSIWKHDSALQKGAFNFEIFSPRL